MAIILKCDRARLLKNIERCTKIVAGWPKWKQAIIGYYNDQPVPRKKKKKGAKK